jgi:CspA family cold shock protein
MARGTVKWFNSQKGYGFIQPQGGGGKDVFVHISAVERAGLSSLNEGQVIEYEIVENRGKQSAENLKVSRWSSDRSTNTLLFPGNPASSSLLFAASIGLRAEGPFLCINRHHRSLLADQQNKSSGSYQQSNQNTDDQRNNPVRTSRRLRPSAFLRRSDAQPEEKFVHGSQRRHQRCFVAALLCLRLGELP